MTSVGRNTYCAYASDVEVILKFGTSEGFGKQVACETAGGWQE